MFSRVNVTGMNCCVVYVFVRVWFVIFSVVILLSFVSAMSGMSWSAACLSTGA